MTWILLIIQLIPAILELIQYIREQIGKQPSKADQTAAWKRLKTICRTNVRKRRGENAYKLRKSAHEVHAELAAFAEELKATAVA